MSAGLKSDSDVFRHRGVKFVGIWNRFEGVRRKVPAVLFLHGFPGAEKNVDIQRELLGRGVASLAPHFRGAWGSEGEYRFSNLVSDARAGLRRLRSMPGVDPRRIGLFGFSFGGWTALHLAAEVPAFRAVVSVSPVGGPEMIVPGARERVARLCRPLRVRSPLALFRDFVLSVRRRDPAESVRRIRAPLLLVHGAADEVVPCEVSKRIFAAAREPKRLVLMPGARHDFLDRRERLARLVSDFLASRLGA